METTVLEEEGWYCGICDKAIKEGEKYIAITIEIETAKEVKDEIEINIKDSVPIAFFHIDCAKDINKVKKVVNGEIEDAYKDLLEEEEE